MKHARKDYDRIQDPAVNDPSLLSPGSTPIGVNEKVFLLRTTDELTPDTIRYWASRLEAKGGDRETVELARRWADLIEQDQKAAGSKLPDTPLDQMKFADVNPHLNVPTDPS